MKYSLHTLASVNECDTVLDKIKVLRKQLYLLKHKLKGIHECLAAMYENDNAYLMIMWNNITEMEEEASLLPPGPEKEALKREIDDMFRTLTDNGLELLLNTIKLILQKEYEIACIEGQLSESLRFLRAIKTFRNKLAA